ncbi:MAG: DUF4440 domain-containing protein [SAR202 cluster bacterium]|nr:DUF4440 domain-containing protein [SAR202 cluster bacterium]
MPARSPEELDRLFAQALNSGNLESLAALYEPAASLSPQPGHTVTGTQGIRQALAIFLSMKPKINLMPRLLAQAGDVALVSAAWTLTGTGPDGSPVNLSGQSAEVCRRQRDGSWRYVIDNPFGLQ